MLHQELKLKDLTGIRVVCGDLEPSMVQAVRERMVAEGWEANASVVDAQVCLTSVRA